MSTGVFSVHPWSSSTNCSPLRKEMEGTSNHKTSMASSCYKMIHLPRKFKPFDKLAVKCCEEEVQASIRIRNAVCTKQPYFRHVLQDVPQQQPAVVVETIWKWVICHKSVRCQGFVCPIGQKETWTKAKKVKMLEGKAKSQEIPTCSPTYSQCGK